MNLKLWQFPEDSFRKTPHTLSRRLYKSAMSSGMHATAAGSSAATTSLNASTPLLATGDWTKNLVHLAKTAELKCVCVLLSSSVKCTLPRYRHPDASGICTIGRIARCCDQSRILFSWMCLFTYARMTSVVIGACDCSCHLLRLRLFCGCHCDLGFQLTCVQKACIDITTPYRAHLIRTCITGPQEQVIARPEGAEEQVSRGQ